MHEGEVFDLLQRARIRPDANWQFGNLLLEGVAPFLRVADALIQFDEQKCHTPSRRVVLDCYR
jgi:hypothetical protein